MMVNLKRVKIFYNLLLCLLGAFAFLTWNKTYSKITGNFYFNTIEITGQKDVEILYRSEYQISIEDLEIDYNGNEEDLILTILPGENYDILPGNTITPTENYDDSWPSRGKTVQVNIQLSDPNDPENQSEIFEFEILVIPPLLIIDYGENACQGIINITASAYKPSREETRSFPFTFKLLKENGEIVEEIEVDYLNTIDPSATAVFGNSGTLLDREESYFIEVEDAIGRTFRRGAGPIGQSYSLGMDLNFSGFLCANDGGGMMEFIVYNAELPLVSFSIEDEDGNVILNNSNSSLNIYSPPAGYIVVNVDGLAAGKYTLEIADRFTCGGKEEFEIVVPPPIDVVEEITDVSCPGENDGKISLTIDGGWSQPFEGNPRLNWIEYSVEWFDAGSGALIETGENEFIYNGLDTIGIRNVLDGLDKGTYYAVITDKGRLVDFPNADPLECLFTSPVYTVDGPDPLQLNSQKEDISCFGADDGAIFIHPAGGTQGYDIKWYKGHIPDLNQPDVNGLELQNPDVSDDDNQRTSLSEGDYSVLLTDNNGCWIAENFTIIEPEIFRISEIEADRQHIFCPGESTGIIVVKIDEFTSGPYLFQLHLIGEEAGSTQQLSTGNEDPVIFGELPAGEYEVIVTDANGCSDTVHDIILTEPEGGLQINEVIISQFNGFQIPCFGALDGSISLDITGEQGDLGYHWTGPDGFTANTPNISDLGPGVYEITITDESNCPLIESFTIAEPDILALNEDISDFNGFQIQCNGGSEGYIRLFPTGGTETYVYNWTGSDGFISSEKDLEGIPAGTYHLTIVDENGCEINKTYEMTEPDGLEITELQDRRENVLCFGASTGKIEVSLAGVSASPFIYYLNLEGEEPGSTITSDATDNDFYVFRDIAAGIYEITVIDNNGCRQTLTGIEITQPETGMEITDIQVRDYNGFQTSCFGADDGHINVELSDGSGNYNYSWTGPAGFTADTPEIAGLSPGIYVLTITDENDCSVNTGEIEIREPDPLSLNAQRSDFSGFGISCFGGNDGYIELEPTGGSGDYTASWTGSNGFSSNDISISGLEAGIYSVVLTDLNGCQREEEFELIEPELLEVSLAGKVDVLCFGEATGSIDLNLTGGTAGYTYEWTRNGLETDLVTKDLVNIVAGNYEVTVMDANGCSVTLSDIEITQPADALEVVITNTEVSCYNANDASLSIAIEGGTAPYQVSWNFGSTLTSFTDLGPGFYQATVTDANGCVVIRETTISDVPVFDVTPEVQQISCFGENDGNIRLNLAGGEAPVRAIWDHGPEQDAVYNLGPGEYGVTITDLKGCQIRRSFYIEEPDILVVTGIVEDALDCDNGQSGSIDLVISGGTPPFVFNWSNGATSQNLQNLSSGQYSVEVVDNAGCYATHRFTVRRPEPIHVNLIQVQEVIDCSPKEVEDRFEIRITGGVAPYTIDWSSGTVLDNGYTMTTTAPGLYWLNVTDGNGCTFRESFEVDNHQILLDAEYHSESFERYEAHLVNMDIEFFNNSSGNILSYYWEFGDGNTSSEDNPTHKYQDEGKYVVTLSAMDINGCVSERKLEIEIWDHYMQVPNAFSPNRDGINDYFYPKFLQVSELKVTIMNKWGEIIFYSEGLNDPGWDGTFRGEDVMAGNYVYRVEYTTIDGRDFVKGGMVLLLR